MALNAAMLDANRTPVPLPGESTIRAYDSGAEVILNVPQDGGAQRFKAMGGIWLTEQRVRRLFDV